MIERCEFERSQIDLDFAVFHQPEVKNGIGHEGLNGGYSTGSSDSAGDGAAGPPVNDMSALSCGICGRASSRPSGSGNCRSRLVGALYRQAQRRRPASIRIDGQDHGAGNPLACAHFHIVARLCDPCHYRVSMLGYRNIVSKSGMTRFNIILLIDTRCCKHQIEMSPVR